MRGLSPEFVMTPHTYEANIKTLHDDNNRPVYAETYNPVDGSERASFKGKNVLFVEEGQGIRTQAFDPSKLEDPSLIIYAPVRVLGNKTIVTNGDQTDTIYENMDKQMTFEQSLRCREFEPDAPNYTPRISGILHFENSGFAGVETRPVNK